MNKIVPSESRAVFFPESPSTKHGLFGQTMLSNSSKRNVMSFNEHLNILN